MVTLKKLLSEIRSLADPERAKHSQRFFKTGKGEYGEGDKFLGLTMSKIRQLAKKYQKITLNEIEKLLQSPIHDQRMIALIILNSQFLKADEDKKEKIYQLYLKNTKWVNNWDLVDTSAHKIIGNYLLNRPKKRKVLYKLARSKNLWEKRISIISTFAFIHQSDFNDALKISEILVNDSHDLIHKAVGWVLREVGKKDRKIEEKFLQKYGATMPRTMLRYSIEKFSPEKRKYYLNLKNG